MGKKSTRRLRLATKPFSQRKGLGESSRSFAQRLFEKHGHAQSWAKGLTLTWLKARGNDRRIMSCVRWSRAFHMIYKTWLNLDLNLNLNLNRDLRPYFDLRRLRAMARKTGPLPSREAQTGSIAAPGYTLRRFHTMVQKLGFAHERVQTAVLLQSREAQTASLAMPDSTQRFAPRAQTSPSRLLSAITFVRMEYFKSSSKSRPGRFNSFASGASQSQSSLSATTALSFHKSFVHTLTRLKVENIKPGFMQSVRHFSNALTKNALTKTELIQLVSASSEKLAAWRTAYFQNRFTHLSHGALGANRRRTNEGLSSGARNGGAEEVSSRAIHAMRPMPKPERSAMNTSHRFAFAPEMILVQPKMKPAESRAGIAPSAGAPAAMAATNGASYSAKPQPLPPAPEIDIARLTERVYSELERKMKNERVRRGL